jgi:hypothetical protein
MASMHDRPYLNPNCSSSIFSSAIIFNLSFKIAAYILEAVAKTEIHLYFEHTLLSPFFCMGISCEVFQSLGIFACAQIPLKSCTSRMVMRKNMVEPDRPQMTI